MVDAMVNKLTQTDQDYLVVRARQDAVALGALYEKYYERILRFCIHRLFNRTTAEDATSTIFLNVARKIGDFEGESEEDTPVTRTWGEPAELGAVASKPVLLVHEELIEVQIAGTPWMTLDRSTGEPVE